MMRRARFALAWAALALHAPAAATAAAPAAAAQASPAPAAPAAVALTGGTVHPVSGPAIENGTVLIRDGRIVAVGADVAVPPDARVVSCAGRQVWPGMISANTVLGLTEVESVEGTNDWQETGSLNPNIRAEVQFNPESELLPVTRANGVTSALVVPGGGAISGTSALMHLDGWTWEDMTLRAPVGLHVRWPGRAPQNPFAPPAPDDPAALRARDSARTAIARTFDDARAYWKARDAEAQKGIPRHDRDPRWDAMGRALRGEIPVMIHLQTLDQIRTALRFVDEQRLPRVVLVGARDAWRVADELKARGIAVICDGTLAMPQRRYEPYDAAFTPPGLLAKAGVTFCVSDGGGGFAAANARNLPYHAAMAEAFGLPHDQAVASVTLYPAQILGVADRLGSIEPGKIADLVVTDGDLLDIATHVLQVWIAGREASLESRQTRLFHKYDARPRGPGARPR